MPQRRRVALAAVLVVAVLSSGGCVDVGDMQFVKDDRLRFSAPDDFERVDLPLEVSWTMEDFEVVPRGETPPPTEDAGYFAVFVDRAPVRPGRTLEDVGKGDVVCESDPRCPDKFYLNSKGVYTTRKPSITLDLVAALSSKEKVQLHQVTVILLDSEGRRIGEYAWYRQFKLENKVLDL